MADLSHLNTLKKPLAILGLGVSGRAVAEACAQSGVPFAVWDDNETRRTELQNQFNIVDFSSDLSSYHALVPAAGIKPSHPVLQKATEQHIPVLSDIDLLIQSAPDARVIGITGTNGKSTTTALINHVLQANEINAQMGGNIGKAACSLPSLSADGVYVLELSSYQLEITAQPICDIAVFLNVTPDHLDWHDDLEHYFQAKKKITLPRPDRMKQQTIIGVDTPLCTQLAEQLSLSSLHHVTQVSTTQPPQDGKITVKDGWLYDGHDKVLDLNLHEYLRGRHNHENVAASYSALRACGLEKNQILPALMSFTGLPHRQKKVAQWQNITFINDSKATNADATSRALASFENIYWIAGGLPKSDGIDGLEKFYPKIHHAFLIGEASHIFAKKLFGQIGYTECGTMEKAVEAAFNKAKQDSGDAVILLSPACASFDQYKNFEERGDHFTALAQRLVEQS